MTLFQPGRDQYNGSNLWKEDPENDGITDFITWYETHSRKTRISVNETYGSNVSSLKCFGLGSYALDLATYSPTDIILMIQN